MRGKDALWVVGVDHAGIATQMVVERTLESQGVRRAEIGREAFLEHVWEWKAQSGGAITRQLRRLGASCDWSNERFTMDEGFSKAVVKVFVELHRRGLLYRDKRLVNWDPRFQTAISDLEVETREVQGQFWTLRYPLAGDARTGTGSSHIKVATTRPETMLADMAVAVHPDDERYKALIGKQVEHPITGRLIPIIADEHADPELGSGAVKITPGHDFNDYEVGKRAGFKPADMLNMFDATAHVVQTSDGLIPQDLVGLSREEARKQVLDRLMAGGFLAQVEDRAIPTPYGDRSGVVIEPWLTDQWYVDVKPLAERVIAATKSGEIKIVPDSWSKTWFHWLENIQPWCVSRQLWWGHRIPAWYSEDGHVFVAETFEQAQQQAGGVNLRQDEDVLDTWFSSALWPFVTLGWPEETHDLKRHYPNDVLNSGFDILFFWDARMAMMGLEFMDEVPWRTLYLHGLIRDAKGQKMSKSKGNTVDPLGIIDKYGADALRFTLAAMESQGRDIKLDEKRVEGYRNFATKLWNAARFLQMNGVGASQSIAAPEAELPVNGWIIGEVVETLAKLDRAFDELRFDEMADAIYHFVWGTFCDWYVELVKGAFDGETKRVAAWAFDQILVMLHPFMPFVTEELWNANERPYELILAKWPAPDASVDIEARNEISWLTNLVDEVRAVRSEMNVPPNARTDIWVSADSGFLTGRITTTSPEHLAGMFEHHRSALFRMARINAVEFLYSGTRINLETGDREGVQRESGAKGALNLTVDDVSYLLPLKDVIDLDAEKARLDKAAAAAEKERDSLAGRLSNPNFTERAKPEAVEKARADHAEKSAEAERYRAALERLG
jgi:valyl-tRNA synthetase